MVSVQNDVKVSTFSCVSLCCTKHAKAEHREYFLNGREVE